LWLSKMVLTCHTDCYLTQAASLQKPAFQVDATDVQS